MILLLFFSIQIIWARYPCFDGIYDFSSLIKPNGETYKFYKNDTTLWVNICEPFDFNNTRLYNVVLQEGQNEPIPYSLVSTQSVSTIRDQVTFKYNQPFKWNQFTVIEVHCSKEEETKVESFTIDNSTLFIKMTSPIVCISKNESHVVAVMFFFFISLTIIGGISMIILYLPNKYEVTKRD
ncbi:hypothetical protein EDI_093840 [Entamoeba dispar SAW760]|uniref:Uncharacterized protein n=1 Tax=Entamoeba dispar (strain ATCC PRA-260 / SAW760) TaxID=370354 RepID=B0EDH6_ENTDS|nr:uncharacterized protein EDI_093840 [Entamoeba dispar SAW760]EDR27593.1 hypothetical protein EDI_093840 [Entamoeba dispar SAW760]|eukprot:EDR27593.1 hypothetical protein EDI_093840 [Entamoeba dispar SAW760]